MATTKIAWGAAQAFTITPGALANNNGRRSAAVDNSAVFAVDAEVIVSMTCAASGVGANGYLAVFAYASADDGTTYETGGSSDAAYNTLAGDEKLIGSAAANINNKIATVVCTVAKVYGDRMPRNWGIIVYNASAAAMLSTGQVFKYQPVTYTVA